MRLFLIGFAAGLLLATPAAAETWMEYTYPDLGFAIQFPGQPVAQPAPVGDHVYALDQDGISYLVRVTDVAARYPDKDKMVDQAVAQVRSLGTVQVESRPRVDTNFGRAIVVAGRDGNRYTDVVFFIGQRLYQLSGTYVPPNPVSGYVMRFQMSFRLLR